MASENTCKLTQPTAREAAIERHVRALLDQLCPDNLTITVDRLASVQIDRASELVLCVTIIVQKALDVPLESLDSETYADLACALRSRYPEFPPETEGQKPITFTRVLLNLCQVEFEQSLSPTDEEKKMAPEELTLYFKRRKDKFLAHMKFIGHLFLRNLLTMKVIGEVVHDIISIQDTKENKERMIECVCTLVEVVGHKLEDTRNGRIMLTGFLARLNELMMARFKASSDWTRSDWTRFQGVVKLRSDGWKKKIIVTEPPSDRTALSSTSAKRRRTMENASGSASQSSSDSASNPCKMWISRKPYHWVTDGHESKLHDVLPFSPEGAAITNYFYEAMPEGTELRRVQRWECKQLFLPYNAYREAVRDQLSWRLEEVESWLFHGTDALHGVLEDGFSSAYVNLRSTKYGAGSYFARDVRVGQYFVRNMRKQENLQNAELQILLCRVVVGWSSQREVVQKKDRMKPCNRCPPEGSQSVTSADMPGREIVVFPGHRASTPAYPAYVLTYTTPSIPDPYMDQAISQSLLLMSFNDREDAHVFNRYRRKLRPQWNPLRGTNNCNNPQAV